MKKSMILIAVAATVGLAAACSPPPSTAGSTDTGQLSPMRTISVQSVGTVTGTPDVATVNLGVQTRAATAEQALASNNASATAVMETLKSAGIDGKDLQTSQLSMHPSYDSDGNTITGYQVTNMVIATVRDVSKAGPLIDAASKAAGESVRVDGVSFSIGDDSALMAAARADAVAKAKTQAEQIAQAAGVSLKGIVSVTEQGAQAPMPQWSANSAMKADAGVPVAPGSQQITLNLSVSYLIE